MPIRTSQGRRIPALLSLGVLLLVGALGFLPEEAHAQAQVSLGMFYDTLSPYGTWVQAGALGRVWRPNPWVVGAGFQPYSTGGHWVDTDYGWSFESDWDWGWAPFHYGRWTYDGYYGWVWAPDTVWAPAWVDWRFGGGYVGWAPLPPQGYSPVIMRAHPYWCFVDTAHFVERDVYHYAVPVTRVGVVYRSTQPMHAQVSHGGASWYHGPPAGHVQQAIGRVVPHAAIAPPPPGQIRAIHANPPGVVSGTWGQRNPNVHATPQAPPRNGGQVHRPTPLRK